MKIVVVALVLGFHQVQQELVAALLGTNLRTLQGADREQEGRQRMREALEVFGRYVSKDLVGQIMRSPDTAGLGGTRRDLTVMFTDIEGFSRISEAIEPELLTSRLSRYFDPSVEQAVVVPEFRKALVAQKDKN